MAPSLSRDQLYSFARRFARWVRVIFIGIIGLGFVGIAALLISIIQFQIRIIEAKNQSRNFSLTSLTQSVAMQTEFMDSVNKVQEAELVISTFEDRQTTYFQQIGRFANYLCSVHDTTDDKNRCALGIAGALLPGAPTLVAQGIIGYFAGKDVSQSPPTIKAIMDETVGIADKQYTFMSVTGAKITEVRSACSIIERYLKSPNEAESALLGVGGPAYNDRSSIFRSFSPEFVRSVRVRCFSHFGLGGLTPVQAQSSLPDLKNSQLLATGAAAKSAANEKRENLEADLAGALFFDLIAYYRFYENIFGKRLTEQMVIAPIDITFVLLVIFCGALGAMLRIYAEAYKPSLFYKSAADVEKTSKVYYFVIGIMCSLIIYILAKTTFAGLIEKAYTTGSGNLNPFVTAFLAIVSGLICEEAFQQIISAGRGLFGANRKKPSGQR